MVCKPKTEWLDCSLMLLDLGWPLEAAQKVHTGFTYRSIQSSSRASMIVRYTYRMDHDQVRVGAPYCRKLRNVLIATGSAEGQPELKNDLRWTLKGIDQGRVE